MPFHHLLKKGRTKELFKVAFPPPSFASLFFLSFRWNLVAKERRELFVKQMKMLQVATEKEASLNGKIRHFVRRLFTIIAYLTLSFTCSVHGDIRIFSSLSFVLLILDCIVSLRTAPADKGCATL